MKQIRSTESWRIFISLPFLFFFLMVFWSCEKEATGFEEPVQPQVENRSDSNTEDILWVVETLHEESEPAVVVFVQKENGEVDVIDLLTYGSEAGDYPLDDFPVPVVEKIVCQGSNNLHFARRAGEWLAAHPGECLKVWTDGNTNYADDHCDTRG